MSAGLTSRPLAEESDWDLVVAVKNGEDLALEILVKRYKARILSLAFHITRNREDAQDVVQQSFHKAFVHLQKFQGKSAFSTWLTRIAINEALMCLRKNRVLETVSLDEEGSDYEAARSMAISDASANPEQTYVQRENEEILSFVIDGLPPILQRTVLLYLDDLTFKEMGQCLGVGTLTVKARLFRGRQRVRALFKRYVQSTGRGVKDMGTPGSLTISSKRNGDDQLLVSVADTGLNCCPKMCSKSSAYSSPQRLKAREWD